MIFHSYVKLPEGTSVSRMIQFNEYLWDCNHQPVPVPSMALTDKRPRLRLWPANAPTGRLLKHGSGIALSFWWGCKKTTNNVVFFVGYLCWLVVWNIFFFHAVIFFKMVKTSNQYGYPRLAMMSWGLRWLNWEGDMRVLKIVYLYCRGWAAGWWCENILLPSFTQGCQIGHL